MFRSPRSIFRGQKPGILPPLFLAALVGALIFLPNCTSLRPHRFKFDGPAITSRLKADIEFLASEELGGRPPGGKFERIAADYISRRFRETGLKAMEFPFNATGENDSILQSLNLGAFLDSHSDSTVIITAHFDHLGQGGSKSLEMRKKGIHPGADDNASGVAMMLEMARHLSSAKNLQYNYLFVGLSCHELGLYGSKALAGTDYFRSFRTRLLLNLDMVGRLNMTSKTIRFNYCQGFPQLAALADLETTGGLKIRPDLENETVNDYSVFCENGCPAISITSGIHNDYHRMTDLPSEINYEGMLMILDLCRKMVTR